LTNNRVAVAAIEVRFLLPPPNQYRPAPRFVLKTLSMTSPTNLAAVSGGRKTRKKPPRAIAKDRRTKRLRPRIYVLVGTQSIYPRYALAHLRNKRGYIYLSWRDGKKIRTFYLGKTPRTYPTPQLLQDPGPPELAGPRRARRRDRGRAKNGPFPLDLGVMPVRLRASWGNLGPIFFGRSTPKTKPARTRGCAEKVFSGQLRRRAPASAVWE